LQGNTEFYSARLTKTERKRNLAEEVGEREGGREGKEGRREGGI
jgi:hypothetical protein